jgi:hypothetical protein
MRGCGALILLLVLAAARASIGAESGGGSPGGQRVPASDSHRSVSGFSGWLIVTPDPDWEAKWNTPAETTPQFNTADDVHMGETLTVLIFYSSPRATAKGEIEIRCDLRVIRPNGTHSVDTKDVDCGSGKLEGPPTNLRLSGRLLKFVGEKGDAFGQYIVEVTLYDKHANVALPLRTAFTLVH